MRDFFAKLETFIFDILGLVLPGMIFLFIVFFPIYFMNVEGIPDNILNSSVILSGIKFSKAIIQNQLSKNPNASVVVILILAYLVGHVLKVFSTITYDFLQALFDKFLNKCVGRFWKFIIKFPNWIYRKFSSGNYENTKIYTVSRDLFGPFKGLFIKVFIFKPLDYEEANEPLKDNCVTIISERTEIKFPKHWYSVYKLSKIAGFQEKERSLSDFFLAKYNLYRSLSFTFILAIMYYKILFSEWYEFISIELIEIRNFIIAIYIIFWFTFHYKYKRYWTLCGNEALVSLFYFLNKDKFNDETRMGITH